MRILGEGQYEVDDATAQEIAHLDDALDAALGANDEAAFSAALDAVVAAITTKGKPLPPDTFVPSDLAVPPAGTAVSDAKALLESGNASEV